MKRVCKYAVPAAIITFLVYHSIYFKSLEDVKEQEQREKFNAAEYARDFWDNQLLNVLDKAVDVKKLIELFNTNMNEAIKRYGKAPGVSRIYAYLVKGNGTILAIAEDYLEVSIREPQTNPDIKIMSGFYIPGNAVRDASGLIDVSEFTDTMKFNEISAEINKIVVKEVIRPFLEKKPKVGNTIGFFGATQVAQDATEEKLFGQMISGGTGTKEFQLITVVPIRFEFE
jgi:predicted lipoprotein